MKISKKLFRISIVVLILVIGLDSLISLYEKRNLIFNKFNSYIENPKDNDKKWSEKIMNGGYILHFRHAERQKWIDVEMYDSLESDVHKNGLNNSRMAENDYFKDAVCLNSRGMIQAKAIGEHLKKIKLPLGYVISSPSCRSRQTAELSFGGFDKLDRNLVHRGPYNQKEEDHAEVLKDLYMNLPINEKNTVVSAHNSVVHPDMFIKSSLTEAQFQLEEGGFYIISKSENGLTMEYKFHNFGDFIRLFYKR
jgi:phosphohistidine phosphatase SixA